MSYFKNCKNKKIDEINDKYFQSDLNFTQNSKLYFLLS